MKNTGRFEGLTRDTYDFLWDIAFHNDKLYFEANRERYRNSVKNPLLLLASELSDVALSVDPAFMTDPAKVLSRIRRDTRFSKDKSMYRDHAWIGYRPCEQSTGESFVLYVEINRDSYGYGMGMYCPIPAMMQIIRERILARPNAFLELVNDPCLVSAFRVEGESYKKNRFSDSSEELSTWLNRKRLAFCYSSDMLEKTMSRDFVDEIKEAFQLMRPLYRFLNGID